MEYISIIISVLGFVFTYTGLVRKVVTKDDLREIVERTNKLEANQVEMEKDIAVIKYRLTLEDKEA